MPARRTLGFLVAAALLAAIVAVSVVRLCCGRPTPHGPSVVLILTDDQRWDTLSQMPNVQRLLVRQGVEFSNGFVVNSLCCPSRASILKGEYSHSTHVYTEAPPNGGVDRFDDSSTVATWLHDAGYHTALFGKYLNGYHGTDVPPGWDEWLAFEQNTTHGYYENYTANDDGTIRRFGNSPADYSTGVLTRRAVSFLHREEGPVFLYYAPYAPHAPSVPQARDRNAFRALPAFDPPSLNEPNVSDKPAWMHALPTRTRAEIDAFRRRQYQSLLAVDRSVGDLVAALKDTGRLHDTMIAFVSDNGIAWGEHRWFRKEVPYEESIRVPFVVRYDAMVRDPRVDPHLVLNIDLAPTIAALAGVDAPDADGRSLVPLLGGRSSGWRHDFLVEHVEGRAQPDPPTFCALRSERYLYVVYATGEQELYDLRDDPFELRNGVSDPAMTAVVSRLQTRLGELCRPKPPGFSVP
jgi:arylsulfatase A-like enzyme